MKLTAEFRTPGWLNRPLAWKVRGAVVAVALLTVAVPVAWASHQFADVPNAQQFHAQIDAIADAGITVGCGGGNYCPADFVRRDQMAAFMHRGLGRVGTFGFDDNSIETSDSMSATVGGLSITPGVPTGALPGANGFFEGHAHINIVAPSSGCPCEYRGALVDVAGGVEENYFNEFYSRVLVTDNDVGHMSLAGALAVDDVGSHIVQLRVFRFSGTGTGATVTGDFTVSYVPFGSEGGDVLSTGGSARSSAEGATPGD